MKQILTPPERLDRLRLLAEHLELDRLIQKSPSQLRRYAELDRLLESTSTKRNRPIATAVAR
jgi:hypothetical protein